MQFADQLKHMGPGNWIMLIVVVLAIYYATKVAKKVLKWVLILAILLVFYNYGTDYHSLVTDTKSKAWGFVEDRAYKSMTENLDTATYQKNPDGSFTVRTEGISLTGTTASEIVKVTYKDISFDVNQKAFINRYIQDVQQ